jgi:hypothetical protein
VKQRRHLVTLLDRERAKACIVSAVGPMVMPSVEAIRQSIVALGEIGPHTRVGLQPSTTSLRWRYAPDKLADCVEIVEPVELNQLDELMSEVSRSQIHGGFRILIAGDFLLVAVSHGLCDARLLVLIQTVLLAGAEPVWALESPPRAMLASTAARWFAAQPRRAIELLRLKRSKGRSEMRTYAAGDLPPAQPTLRWVAIDETIRAEMRRRLTTHSPKATEATAWFSVLARALRYNGIEISEKVVILADARRYRRRSQGYLANFAVGLEFDFAEPYDPEPLSMQVQDALRAGRPLAAMMVGALRALIATRGSEKRCAVADKPIVSFSDIGRAVDESSLPWKTDERAYIATTEGVGYNGISFILVEIGDAVLVQCSFNAVVHSPELIESTLALLNERSAELLAGITP